MTPRIPRDPKTKPRPPIKSKPIKPESPEARANRLERQNKDLKFFIALIILAALIGLGFICVTATQKFVSEENKRVAEYAETHGVQYSVQGWWHE